MRFFPGSLIAAAFTLILAGCASSGGGRRPPMLSLPNESTIPVYRSAGQLAREVNVKQSLVPSGKYCRKKAKRLTPKYITIHSTANMTADAWQHAKALNRGAIRGGTVGYLGWHFTVDQRVTVQHMPLTEQGHHAEYDGPGNRTSFGIEMCEFRGNSMPRTYDRTAKLAAVLMKQYRIPLRNVVPHYYWTRKNCPRPLLENGRPGQNWAWFLSRVDYYYRCINMGVPRRS